MDKLSLASKISRFSLILLVLDINVKPYEKNFILTQDVDEFTLDRILRITRTTITFNIGEQWIEDNFLSLTQSKKDIKYNIILSGELSDIRIKNIKRLSPLKVAYSVNEFLNIKKINQIERLRPSAISLIFKRLPEPFEIEVISNSKIKDLTIMIDEYSIAEFLNRKSDFTDTRLTLKPLDITSLKYLCEIEDAGNITSIIIDSRIISPLDLEKFAKDNCESRIIYELSSATLYNSFLFFIKSKINSLNIYLKDYPARNNIIDWIKKTDP